MLCMRCTTVSVIINLSLGFSNQGMHRDEIFHPNSFLRYMQNNVENITPGRACNMHQNSFVQIWVHRTSFFLPLCFAAVI